jgi:hypothetical protein
MIYMIMNENVAEHSKIPRYLAYHSDAVSKIPRALVQAADFVFIFVEGKTSYYKDRFGDNHQYTDEEKVVLKLRSVLI